MTLPTFTFRPIGFVRTPFTETSQISKGIGAKHAREGTLEILPEMEEGLLDIEGFSHLFVIWVFDRSTDYELVGKPPTDDRPHGVFAHEGVLYVTDSENHRVRALDGVL